MAAIQMMGHLSDEYSFFVLSDSEGDLRTFVGTRDALEEMARELLDLVGRGYCLPYVCDHLDVAERAS